MINKNNRAIDKMTHGIRSPSAKYFNTVPMLIATDNSPINDVINTGIVGVTKTDLLKLDFFGKFYDTITLMTKLKKKD